LVGMLFPKQRVSQPIWTWVRSWYWCGQHRT
jgi:hypothetical protein